MRLPSWPLTFVTLLAVTVPLACGNVKCLLTPEQLALGHTFDRAVLEYQENTRLIPVSRRICCTFLTRWLDAAALENLDPSVVTTLAAYCSELPQGPRRVQSGAALIESFRIDNETTHRALFPSPATNCVCRGADKIYGSDDDLIVARWRDHDCRRRQQHQQTRGRHRQGPEK